ncbi:hypothetical protein GCM10027073_25510 [Streptomyces chlorus]
MWDDLQRVLLDRLREADRLDFSRATIDAPPGFAGGTPTHVPVKRGRSSPKAGPSPVDRGRPGSKHHVLTDAHGAPLRMSLTGGHRNAVTQLLPLVDGVPPVRGKRDRPRRKPRALYADRGYDHELYRRRLRERGIVPKIARRGQSHGSGPGRARRVAESAIAWLHGPAAYGLAGRPETTGTMASPTRPLHDPRPQTPSIPKALLRACPGQRWAGRGAQAFQLHSVTSGRSVPWARIQSWCRVRASAIR